MQPHENVAQLRVTALGEDWAHGKTLPSTAQQTQACNPQWVRPAGTTGLRQSLRTSLSPTRAVATAPAGLTARGMKPSRVEYSGQSQERGLNLGQRLGGIHVKLSEMNTASLSVCSHRQPGNNCHILCADKASVDSQNLAWLQDAASL